MCPVQEIGALFGTGAKRAPLSLKGAERSFRSKPEETHILRSDYTQEAFRSTMSSPLKYIVI